MIAGTPREPVRYLLIASRLSPSLQRVSATRHGFYSLKTDWTRTPPRVRPLRIDASRAEVTAPVSGGRPAARRFEGISVRGDLSPVGVALSSMQASSTALGRAPGDPRVPVGKAVEKPLAYGE